MGNGKPCMILISYKYVCFLCMVKYMLCVYVGAMCVYVRYATDLDDFIKYHIDFYIRLVLFL